MIRHSQFGEQISYRLKDIVRLEPPDHDNSQHPELSAVKGSVLNEVARPDMILPAQSEPHAGAIVQPKPSSFGLPRRHLQSLSPPDSLYTLVVDVPALCSQQVGDASLAIATKLAGRPDDVGF